ncbi:MAG: twin-arginine translocase subunit TatC [Bryobacteraceae bacterium]
MDSADNKPGASGETQPEGTYPEGTLARGSAEPSPHTGHEQSASEPAHPGETHVSHEQTTDATSSYSYHDDYGYGYEEPYQAPAPSSTPEVTSEQAGSPAPPGPPPSSTPPPKPPEEDDDPDEEGMLRMSFLEHLEELRQRLIHSLAGMGVAFVACLYFTPTIWDMIQQPFLRAMELNGVKDPKLAVLTPTEAFSIIWVKVPILCSIFLASPWILYQVWSFIAPGLYKKERRLAAPFVLCTAGLFIIGGLFAYFVAFRLGLAFLLGIGIGNNLQNVISITEYFDLFVNVSLGMGLVFELPVLIFFLSLLRIITPQFLLRNSRYAILAIVIIAAFITPTPDVINLLLIAVPMTALYFAGVFASYLLWLSREGKKFPWALTILIIVGTIALMGIIAWIYATRNGLHFVPAWPFLVQ